MEQGLGSGWAAGDVNIHRQEAINTGDNRIALFEGPSPGGTGAHRQNVFGFRHLVVKPDNLWNHFFGNRARDNHHVCLARTGTHDFHAKAGEIVATGGGGDHFDSATSQAEHHWPD